MNTSLNIAALQYDIAWEDVRSNLVRLDTMLNTLSPEVQLIVLPEMFATGFLNKPASVSYENQLQVLDWLKQRASTLQAVIIGSHPYLEKGIYHNRLLVVYPNSNILHYNKRHLFTMGGEHTIYQGGQKRLIVEIDGWKLCPLICYDLRFPVWSRNTEDFDALVYIANWPAARAEHWDKLLMARAIENQCYVMGVNRIGIDGNHIQYAGASQVISSYGDVLARADNEECIVEVELDREKLLEHREKFPVLNDRDAFNIK